MGGNACFPMDPRRQGFYVPYESQLSKATGPWKRRSAHHVWKCVMSCCELKHNCNSPQKSMLHLGFHFIYLPLCLNCLTLQGCRVHLQSYLTCFYILLDSKERMGFLLLLILVIHFRISMYN